MKNIITVFLLIISLGANAQRTYDTTITTTTWGTKWNAKITVPANYATTTATYPMAIYFTGLGEVGTNAALMNSAGPHKYITSGKWKAGVRIGSDTTSFIIVSVQPAAAWPGNAQVIMAVNELQKSLRESSTILMGISMGAQCAMNFVTADVAGSSLYAAQIKAVINVEGVKPNGTAPLAYPDRFDAFAKVGTILCFDQKNDPGRDMMTYVNRMNSIKANSAVYFQTNFGDGSHCCWDSFYGGTAAPAKFTIDGISQNIYEWMARQSKPVIVPPPPPPNKLPAVYAGGDQSITLPVNSITLKGSASDTDGVIKSYDWEMAIGKAGAVFSGATSPTLTVTNLSEGQYTFRLTATDNTGGLSCSDAIITVKPKPLPVKITVIYSDNSTKEIVL